MRAVRLVYRAQLRDRWRSLAALALLVTVAGGAVTATVAAARRTSSAFPSFVARYGFDVLVLAGSQPLPVGSLPDVERVVALRLYGCGLVRVGRSSLPVSTNVGFFALPDRQSPPVVKLLEGHMPVASEPDEVLASFTFAQHLGVRIGSLITVHTFSPSQARVYDESNGEGEPPTHGPTLRLKVVGFEVFPTDFPVGAPSYTLVAGPDFERDFGAQVLSNNSYLVRLRHGAADVARFSAAASRLPARDGVFAASEDDIEASVRQSIAPQVTGWELLALLVALAALAVVSQAVGRLVRAVAESFPVLGALGMRPRQLYGLGLLTIASAGAMGAVGTVAVAFTLSPLTPVGLARIAATSTGFDFDPVVLLTGAAVVVVASVALGAVPAWRAAHHVAGRSRPTDVRGKLSPLTVAGRLGPAGAPSALVGIRRALQRGRGRASLPVGTALLGTTLAITALVATAVFGASLSNLVTTPLLYGQASQLALSNGMTGRQVHSFLPAIEAKPAVDRITYGLSGAFISIGGLSVKAVIAAQVRGPLDFSDVGGRLPAGAGQITLGNSTLRALGAHIGSVIPVTLEMPSSAPREARFEVVGTTSFSPGFETGGLGEGAVLTINGALNAFCPSSPGSRTCRRAALRALGQIPNWGMLISVVPGRAGQAALSSLRQRYAPWVSPELPPTDLVNFGQAVNFPLLFEITLALLGASTLTHLLVTSVARRRHDVALLKSVGFVRRQVAAAVCWQATTIAIISVAFGVPIGIAVGRLLWRAYALNLGAVPAEVVPAGVIVGLAAGVVVVANLLSGLPAMTAARMKPAEAFREA